MVGGQKQRGVLTLTEERHDRIRASLLWQYGMHLPFVLDWLPILHWYERLLQALRQAGQQQGLDMQWPESAWESLHVILERKPHLQHLHVYRDEIQRFCDRWGLCCDWAPAWVHHGSYEWARHVSEQEILDSPLPDATIQALKERGVLSDTPAARRRLPWLHSSYRLAFRSGTDIKPPMLGGFVLSRSGEKGLRLEDQAKSELGSQFAGDAEMTLNVRYNAFAQWENVKERVLKEARRQWEETRRKYLEAGAIITDTEPSLLRHTHWLFLRICPQEDIGRPWGWQRIAREEFVSPTTVRNNVLALARSMGITLPPLPSGAPRRGA
jgi:hypothetical protein